ncbi:MAG: delta 1-pyrroline-5-carboxylate reductase [Icmadophila ericetorum]|nr:delta 1-pyrroline-5-carboxylate reductase [Icmadophila ericetorum]
MPEIAPIKNEATRLSIAIIGCGKLGTALLRGFLSLDDHFPTTLKGAHLHRSKFPLDISHIYATVTSSSSLERIYSVTRSAENTLESGRLVPQVIVGLQEENARFVEEADLVILGCKPQILKEVLGDSTVQKALVYSRKEKTLVSILGGVPISEIEDVLYQHEDSTPGRISSWKSGRCLLIRAIPNIAARIQGSITVLASSPSLVQARDHDGGAAIALVDNLFKHVGSTKWIAESQMNHASALCASALAFYARIIAAAADGAKGDGEGLSDEDAIQISAHAARGACGLILDGECPEFVESQVATKGGSTMAGLKLLDDRGVITAMRDAVEQTAIATKNLTASFSPS